MMRDGALPLLCHKNRSSASDESPLSRAESSS